MLGQWSESVIRGVRREQTCTHTHLRSTFQTWEWCCLHQIWWWVLYRQRSSLCWCKLPVLSLTLSIPSFVWTACASRLCRSDWEQLLSGEAYKRAAAQQPSRKATPFNCSKKRRSYERWREALGWESSDSYILWNLSASCAEVAKGSMFL